MTTRNRTRWTLAAVLLFAGMASAQVKPGIASDKPADLPVKPTDRDKPAPKSFDRQIEQLKARLVQLNSNKLSPPEYLYVGVPAGTAPTATEFERAAEVMKATGYGFTGTMPMKTDGREEEVPTSVFRRTKPEATTASGPPLAETDKAALLRELELVTGIKDARAAANKLISAGEVRIPLSELGGDFDAASKLLVGLVRLKFGDEAAKKVTMTKDEKFVSVTGRDEDGAKYARWLADHLKELRGAKPPAK